MTKKYDLKTREGILRFCEEDPEMRELLAEMKRIDDEDSRFNDEAFFGGKFDAHVIEEFMQSVNNPRSMSPERKAKLKARIEAMLDEHFPLPAK